MLTSSNPTLDGVTVAIWTQTELAYSLAMATMPCLLPVLMKLNTGIGAILPDTVIRHTQSDSLPAKQSAVGGSFWLESRSKQSNHMVSGHDVSAP